MNLEQIKQGILAKFEKCRLVFWQDDDNEFQEQFPELSAELQSLGINAIALDSESHLEVKQRIELLEPEQNFLLYSNEKVNEPTRDWLFDIRLYAQQFYADSSSMILNELGMRMEFRQLVSRYKKFFGSKQRYSKLRNLLPDNADKKALELAMIATLAKVESVSFTAVLNELISKYSKAPELADEILEEIEKYGLEKSFWTLAIEEFGYLNVDYWLSSSEESAKSTYSVKDLITKLLVTDCYHGLQSSGASVVDSAFAQSLSSHLLPITFDKSLNEKLPKDIKDLAGSTSAKKASVINFVKAWRESRTLSKSYNLIAKDVSFELEIKNKLAEFKQPSDLLFVETFVDAEEELLKMLAKDLPAYNSNDIADWVSIRLRSHWCYQDEKYAAIHRALKSAKKFYELKEKYVDGFDFMGTKKLDTASALYKAYEVEIHQFDTTYRIFSENSLRASQNGSDILKLTGLVDDIESLYVDWFLHDFAIAWGKLVDKESLLENWKLPIINNQYEFYNREVQKVLLQPSVKRVFVIISDAFRYECAKEIHDSINNRKRYKSELTSQLGVVPSYTQAGMASLLPYRKFTAHLNKSVEYKLDGISAHGTENRHKILQAHGGIACTYDDVMKWTNQQYRDLAQDSSAIYIYHNKIDAIGDDGGTENEAFLAARDAIDEIDKLIIRIFDKLKGGRVILTADHGFLFNQSDVTESDRTALQSKPPGTKISKKRYLVGENLPKADSYWVGKMSNTANVLPDSDAEFIVPRGSNRFHFVGGAKFIHGGIMPQEICVPVMHLRAIHSTVKEKQIKKKVGVVPLNSPIKIVSNIDSIQFLQADPIGDSYVYRDLKIWLEDPEGNHVSSPENIRFDSVSEKMEERKRSVQVKLEGSGFDRTISYKLVMEDTESKTKTTYSVTIDLAFEDDFF
ncbi:BREX-1 system phosphatase PglZ type A [Colwellia sp. Arc7-D]|uniref:BREX-1 system phosphatase PglZ type A n=1 Tax=Colwellia sp. Arc7-D TaxID=2161872 RepID=UPI000D3D4DBE|nr:BREX-1 system phosphatase PglZ type A [Colwellia sp. Arc7-D]AWB57831.1 BREX-1 system phosphatase PglZ type A [Colwellia sp. Arc7-D]